MTAGRNILSVFAALGVLSLAAPLPADDSGIALTPHSAEYRIKISVLGGHLHTTLAETETGYRAESSIQATGMSRLIARGAIRESSVFHISDAGIRPERFVSSDTLSKGGQEVDLSFDWISSSANGFIDSTAFSTEFDDVTHDRVSLQYGLMHDLLNGIEKNQYYLQDAEKFKPLSITNVGRKSVKVPFGRFEAVGIQHQALNSSRVTTLWCVEELDYLPVIIEQHRKGKLRVRAVLTDYQPAG